MAAELNAALGPAPRSFDAMVFDLFGTLVHELPRSVFYGVVDAMADAVGVDRGAWRDEWDATAAGRQTGTYRDIESNVREIGDLLGLALDDEAVARALEPRSAMYDEWFRPREGAVEAVRAIASRGYPLALISMCAPDTPGLWRASVFARLFDVEVFSSEVGLRKPDPSIFLLACERLGVSPEACLYCGDGAYGELTGAEAVGMTAVLIRDPSIDHASQLTPERDAWSERVIGDLSELLEWLPGR